MIVAIASRTQGSGPAINRCRQKPDRIAPPGHPMLAGWCPSAGVCCSLRSKLLSRDGNRPSAQRRVTRCTRCYIR